jgi:hypothetical protein
LDATLVDDRFGAGWLLPAAALSAGGSPLARAFALAAGAFALAAASTSGGGGAGRTFAGFLPSAGPAAGRPIREFGRWAPRVTGPVSSSAGGRRGAKRLRRPIVAAPLRSPAVTPFTAAK